MKQRKPESPLQKFVVSLLLDLVDSNKEFEEKTGITHNMLSNYQHMYNYMGIDKLERIFTVFPEIKTKVALFLAPQQVGLSGEESRRLFEKLEKSYTKLEKSYSDNIELLKAKITEKDLQLKELGKRFNEKQDNKTRPTDD
jgi:transcriptional regulator with XRE-family HTH domain